MTHPLLPDEAVEAAGIKMPWPGHDVDQDAKNQMALVVLGAFIAHHEGERVCEPCKGTGYDGRCNEPDCEFHRYFSTDNRLRCKPCKGTGKITERRLVTLELDEVVVKRAELELLQGSLGALDAFKAKAIQMGYLSPAGVELIEATQR